MSGMSDTRTSTDTSQLAGSRVGSTEGSMVHRTGIGASSSSGPVIVRQRNHGLTRLSELGELI
jgi:hypothetical protein